MNSSKRTLEITLSTEQILQFIASGVEGLLRTTKKIKPREELLKTKISADSDAPWYALTDVPLELELEELKEVERTEVDGKRAKL